MKIAIDIGRVMTALDLIDRWDEETKTYRSSDPLDGCLEYIRRIVKKYGAENVFVISRVQRPEGIAANWTMLTEWNFWEITGVLPENTIIFLGTREDKSTHVRKHGINVVIDDRYDCLVAMDEGVRLIAFNPDLVDTPLVEGLKSTREHVDIVRGWKGSAENVGVAELLGL